MKRLIVCVWLFYSVSISFAQTNLRFDDVRSAGMGGSGSLQSAFFNPACLALSTSQYVEVNYFNKYQLKELSSVSALYGCPSFLLPFGVSVSTFGYGSYRETMFRLSLSKAISSGIILGISTQYAMLQTDLYTEEVMTLSTDVGILFLSGDNLLIGLLITDLPSVRLDDKQRVAEDFTYYSIQGGFNWKFINNLLIAVSASYSEPTLVRFKAGMEYTAYDSFFIRAGLQTNPLKPAFGAGLSLSAFQLDVAVDYHSQLGIGSGIGLTYFF